MFEELCETITSSWDDDGEMRLTSASIESRLDELFKQYPQPPNDFNITVNVELNNCRNLAGWIQAAADNTCVIQGECSKTSVRLWYLLQYHIIPFHWASELIGAPRSSQVIWHVNEYPTIHYFGTPRHTQSMIAYIILTKYLLKFQWKVVLWECW